MARNEEKSHSLFNRWVDSKAERLKGTRAKRPFRADQCEDLDDAEYWRRQVIGEISRKVAEIQNAGLGEERIRDLNDEINKRLREKGHWERQIRKLGGPHYRRGGCVAAASLAFVCARAHTPTCARAGACGPQACVVRKRRRRTGRGRRLGRRALPVLRRRARLARRARAVRGRGPRQGQAPHQRRRAFARRASVPPCLWVAADARCSRRRAAQISKRLDPDYYGFRDEDDGVLLREEAEAERRAVAKALKEWEERQEEVLGQKGAKRARLEAGGAGALEDLGDVVPEGGAAVALPVAAAAGGGAVAPGSATGGSGTASAADDAQFKSHVVVPTQEEVAREVLARKKAAMLAKLGLGRK